MDAARHADLFSSSQDFYYVNQEYTPVPNPEVAFELQDRLIRFVNGGDREWPVYGDAKRLFNVTMEGFERTKLAPHLERRCEAITAALLDPANGVVER